MLAYAILMVVAAGTLLVAMILSAYMPLGIVLWLAPAAVFSIGVILIDARLDSKPKKTPGARLNPRKPVKSTYVPPPVIRLGR